MQVSPEPTPLLTSIENRRSAGAVRLDFDAIPIIDLGPAVLGDDGETRRIAQIIRDTARDVGFFYVKNHGIDAGVLERALLETRDFFDLPEATKLKYDIGRIKRHRGYVPTGALSADPELIDHQQGYEIGPELPPDDPDYLAGNVLLGPNVWPEELPAFRTDVYRYFEEAMGLGRLLFKLFAVGLDLAPDYFDELISKPTAQLRLIHYPAMDPSVPAEEAIGIGPHTDYECFTILWQTEHGLQVQNPLGQWIEAPPIPGTFVINIGDLFQRWTNDLFVSTPHRVVSNTGRRRYSFPLFFGLNHDVVVKCLDTCQGPDNPRRYPPTHCGHWIETMHTYSYRYRWHERGRIPNPELG